MTPLDQKKADFFHEWQQALAASGESPSRLRVFEGESMGFLRQCEQWHSLASVESAKQYLAAQPTQDGNGRKTGETSEDGKTEDGRRWDGGQ